VYQYSIPNYETLWSAATGQTGSSSVFFATTFTEVNARSQAGRDFINAWTGSTIEGVNGVTRDDARWKIFWGSDIQITGGTYYSATTTLDLFNNTGGTVTITGFTGTVTGGTYNSGTETLTLDNSDGSNVEITTLTASNVVQTNATKDLISLDVNLATQTTGTINIEDASNYEIEGIENILKDLYDKYEEFNKKLNEFNIKNFFIKEFLLNKEKEKYIELTMTNILEEINENEIILEKLKCIKMIHENSL
jgi:hypothetical protein